MGDNGKPTCSVEGCSGKPVGFGMCDLHYRRKKKYGDINFTKHEQHGKRHSKVYRTWCHIKGRCLNPSDSNYKDYGGRGITISDEWRDSFIAFYDNMGDPPTSRHTIERIDNNKGYQNGNCRWATYEENNQNRRSTKLTAEKVAEIKASNLSGAEAAEKYGVSYSQVQRIRSGKRWRNK